jgi:hypothetical protein
MHDRLFGDSAEPSEENVADKCFFDCGTTEEGAISVCLSCYNEVGVELDKRKEFYYAMESAYHHTRNILDHANLIEDEELRAIIHFSANAACNFLTTQEDNVWYNGDYRAIVRYEWRPSELADVEANDAAEKSWNDKVWRAMNRMFEKGEMDGIRDVPSLEMSKRAAFGVNVITVIVLQKRIREDGLQAWATLGLGFSFCQERDQFNKKGGRRIALQRALVDVAQEHRDEFLPIVNRA